MGALRVGLDAHVLDGRYQGSRTWLVEILRRVPAMAPDITFVVYSADRRRVTELLADAPVEHRALQPGNAITRNLVTWPRLIREHHLDLLVTQYFCAPRHPGRQVPVIHDVLFQTHPQFFPFKYRWRNRILVGWAARHARSVITVSEYSREQIALCYGRDPAAIAIVNNGVDAASFHPVPGDADPAAEARETGALTETVTGGRPYALFVGRLEPRKNLRLLLDAFDRIDDPDVRLVVVGRDDFEEPQVLDRLAATDRAVHLVDVADAQLRELYRDAAVLVFPSLGEGWGIPVLEALAAGTPVLASDVTAIPEAGGPACHYFSPTAPDAADRLAELVTAALSGLLPFDQQAAAAHVRSLSWDHSAEQFLRAIRATSGERIQA